MRGSNRARAAFVGAVAALVVPLSMSAAAARSNARLHLDYNLSLGDYAGPLQFAKYGPHTYVADSFTSHLWEIGVSKPLATGPDPSKGGDLAGVAVNPDNGDVAYTSSDFQHHVKRLVVLHDGRPSMVSYLGSYEWRSNPDKTVVYGLLDPAHNSCAADTLRAHGLPARYTGGVDSHPYAVAYLGGGAWAVADAGGNDIVRVGPTGDVSLIRVLPRQALEITDALADALHLDKCAVGQTYYTEPVPTDVEVGPNGLLYTSTLPGGPDDPAAGPRGAVYALDRSSGVIHLIGSGLASPTNLAVTSHSAVYVAEPFAGQIVVAWGGDVQDPRMSLVGAVALEYVNGKLYVATAPGLVGASNPARVARVSYQR